MVFDFITWSVDPDAFSIWGREIRWYGILLATGFYLAFLIIAKLFKKQEVSEANINSFSIFVIVGAILGLRLGHCFFYEPGYYLSNPLEIVKVWKGGLASHGGAVGILVAVFLFSRKYKLSYLWLLDRLVIVIALAGAFVRIGNLMNSEIYGMPTDLPWAFIFTHVDDLPRHPSQIYEALYYLILFGALLLYHKKIDGKINNGLFFGIFMITLFGFRFFIEFIKDVQVDFEHTIPLKMGQLLSIPFVIVGIILVIRAKEIKKSIE